jgi:hypothetical protein
MYLKLSINSKRTIWCRLSDTDLTISPGFSQAIIALQMPEFVNIADIVDRFLAGVEKRSAEVADLPSLCILRWAAAKDSRS